MWIKNKEPVIQNGRHMHRPKLTQALQSVRSTVSPPTPTHHRERPRLNQQPAFGMTVQSRTAVSKQCLTVTAALGGFYERTRPFYLDTVKTVAAFSTDGALCRRVMFTAQLWASLQLCFLSCVHVRELLHFTTVKTSPQIIKPDVFTTFNRQLVKN